MTNTSHTIYGDRDDYKVEVIIGLEVHVELTTKSKMFCGCPADHFGRDPNTATCPVCLGLPGALPVPNKRAVEDTIKIGLALGSKINEHSHFDRKQYFYPDLSKSYQISQYDEPLCVGGQVVLDSGKVINIERVHLEEDTGKLQHEVIDGKKVTLIDFNRSGVPLVEIVSKPDLSSPEEAKEYLKKIHQIIRELKVSSADLEKGQVRLEPTVNLKLTSVKDGSVHFTPLVELKNINSFNFAASAIDFEIERQTSEFLINKVEKTENNKTTRGYDSVKKITFPQREKEEAKDYRYFPEPDIPPLVISRELVEKLKNELPILPDAIVADLVSLGVKLSDAKILAKNKIALAVLESNSDLPQDKLASLIVNKKIDISGDIRSQYKEMSAQKDSDENQLSLLAEKAINENPQAVADHKRGKNSIGFLVGQVMKLSGGKADAKIISRILLEKLTAQP